MLIEDTLWHHAVFNYDGSLDGNDGQNRVEIYLDNVKQETQLSSTGILGDIQNGTAHLSLGVPLGSTGNICGGSYFDGVMDDIRLYNRTLSDAEVDTLYNEENPFSSIEEMIINPTVFYPNPAGNFITLDISMDKFDEIAIYSLHGQELRRFSSGSSTINISSLAEGIYIISIFKDKEWILSQKLVVGFH
jgi:hypothetical protein